MDIKNQKKKSNQKKIALYLDDLRTPIEEPSGYKWKVVKTYKEFVDFISSFYKKNKKLPGLISFDHDLTQEHMNYFIEHPTERIKDYGMFKDKTGMHCAVWLTQTCEKNNINLGETMLAVHSHNPIGANNIQSHLNDFKGKQLGADKADAFLMKWPFKYNE